MYMSSISYLKALLIDNLQGGLSMKRETTLVPMDKCPLDVLAEMGERTSNAWIFLHLSVLKKLKESCDTFNDFNHNRHYLTWEATEEYPATEVVINNKVHTDWVEIFRISASDIAFSVRPRNPEEIYFLKMDE